jgi:hypothetical protein
MCQGVRKWEVEQSIFRAFPIVYFPPAAREGALALVLNTVLEPHRHSSRNSNQRETVQTVS